MKILYILNDTIPFSTGGLEIYAYNLSQALRERGHEVTIFSATDNTNKQEYEVEHHNYNTIPIITVTHRMLGIRRDVRVLQLLLGLKNIYIDKKIEQITETILNSVKPDIVHIHHLVHLSDGIVELIKRRGIPVVLTLHDYWFLCANGKLLQDTMTPHLPNACDYSCLTHLIKKSYPGYKVSTFSYGVRDYFNRIPWFCFYYYVLMRKNFFSSEIKKRRKILQDALLKADLLIAPSRFLWKLYIESGIPPSKIMYSGIGIDAKNFQRVVSGKQRPPRQLRFGYIGRIVPEKGIHVLINAFNQLKKNSAALEIYGNTHSQFNSYQRYIKSMAIHNPAIEFRGEIPHRQIEKVLRDIDILVMPSLCWENSPLVIQEAFLARIPVITSNIGGMRELVQHMKNGLLFQVGNSQDLKEKMESVLYDITLIKRLSSGIGPIKNIEENADELLAIYKSFPR